MSERRGMDVFMVIAAIVVCGTVGWLTGRDRGRAEQKKWDAAHPVVKEVPPVFTFDTRTGGYQCAVQDSTHLICDERLFQKLAPDPPAKPKSHRPSYLRLLPDISDGLLEHESGRIIKKLEGAASIEKSDVFVATGMLGECVKRLKQKSYVPVMWDCGDGKPTTAPCPAEKP